MVITFSFFFNVYITFNTKKDKKKTFVKYLAALLVFAGLDAALVRLLTDVLSIYYMFSITVVMVGLFVLKFFFYQKFVFVSEISE